MGAAAARSPIGLPNLDNGQRLQAQVCELCHGADGLGGHEVGAALMSGRTLAEVVGVVTEEQNTMPGFGAALSVNDIRDVNGYAIELVRE